MIINQYNFLYKLKWWIKKRPFLLGPIITHNLNALHKDNPLFGFVEIETFNRCNGKCSFCPANRYSDIRKPQYMDEQLYYKILDELAELDYRGRLALFSNNEPFLDDRIYGFAKIARIKLPKAHIYIYCNGLVINLKRFKEIIEYLDELVIDNYSDALELSPNVKEISQYCQEHPELGKKCEIYVRKENEVLSNRGNYAPNKKVSKRVQHIKCLLPYVQMVIRPDGKVSLCCNDVYGMHTMGDCSTHTLKEVWMSEEFLKIRKIMKEEGRAGIAFCKYCDNTTAAAVSVKYGKKRFLFSKIKNEKNK